MDEKNEDFPNGLQAFLLVLALFVAEFIVGAAMHDAQGVLALTPPQSAALISVLGNGCLFAFILHFKGLTYRNLFQPSGEPPTRTLLAFVAPVMMLVPALVLVISVVESVVTNAIPLSDGEKAMFAEMSADDLATTLVTCIIAPVVEEMLFRGVILRSFLHQYGRTASILGSAALFGLAHLNIYQFCSALIVGTLSGWLYARVRSLVPCIALHASFNTTLMALDRTQSATEDSIAGWTGEQIFLVSMVLAIAGALLLASALRRHDEGPPAGP